MGSETKAFSLRPMQRSDLDLVLGWRNHPSVRQYMFMPSIIPAETHRKWFEAASQNPNKFLFVFENAGVPAGFVSFSTHESAKIADWGFYLAPDAPKGSGRLLGQSALDHAFKTLKFHKVCGQVIDKNSRSIRFHEKLGFKREGLFRAQYLDGETYRDVAHFGMLCREWDPANIYKGTSLTNPEIKIAGRQISASHPPYVIAEISANHNGKIENAMALISEAKKAGAGAVKLQTYRPDTITLDCDSEDFQIKGGLWDGQTLFQLYEKAHMPWEWHAPLFDHARKTGITIFSSPFDSTAVDLLENLNAPAYKIASFEAIDLPLIRYAASTGKPLIISTGMADAEEISEAIEAARSSGCTELAILHCVSGYPARADDYNLRTIPDMIRKFGLVTGLSDHTLDNTTAIASVALGAAIIEKHFTLNRHGGGPDDSFSLEPAGMAELCSSGYTAWSALGKVDYGRKSSELENTKFRRSLYYVKKLGVGEVVTADAVRSVRPGYGAAPKYLDDVIGKKTSVAIEPNTPVVLANLY